MIGYELKQKTRGFGDSKGGLSVGYFVFYEDSKKLLFMDCEGKQHGMARVSLLTEEADTLNNYKNIPKPCLSNKTGEINSYGSPVLYSFIGDAKEQIVVFGALRDLEINAFDKKANTDLTNYENIEEKHRVRENEKRYVSFSDDAKGNVEVVLEGKDEEGNGNLVVKILSANGQKAGNVKLELNGKLAINITDDEQVVHTQLFLDNTTGNESVTLVDKHKNKFVFNKKGTIIETATIRIGKDETLKKILIALLDAIKAMTHSTPAGPTIAPPINWSAFQSVIDKLDKFMDVQ